ncbi:MAG: YfhO family protein [Candidatus Dormibacteraceae bacterium]
MPRPDSPPDNLSGSARNTPALLLALVALGLLIIVFTPVILGQKIIVGGGILTACCDPWAAAPHAAGQLRNGLMGDMVTQFTPWQEQVLRGLHALRLPTWDSLAMSGKPLLANDQSGVFSPFTLIELAFPTTTWGMSMVMLAKLVVAAATMFVFGRSIGMRSLAAVMAGVAYAGSSFMVVWLGWPHTVIAALLPLAFAGVEWYLRTGRRLALALLAGTLCAQFLGGHAETSVHLGFGLLFYSVVRWLFGERQLGQLFWLGAMGVLGTAAAAIQLVPFVDILRTATLVGDRSALAIGIQHLPAANLISWVVPNIAGNPSIDGRLGLFPNYNEGTGFASLTMLLLAPIGVVVGWRRRRPSTIALTVLGVVAFGLAYTPLALLLGRLPVLSVTNNGRAIVLCCFVVSALGGCGASALFERASCVLPEWWGAISAPVSVALLGVLAILATRFGLGSHMPWRLWALLVGASGLTAIVAHAAGWRRLAPFVLAGILLLEVATFAFPFEVQLSPSTLPPPSPILDWVRAHTGDVPIAAVGPAVPPPETLSLAGIPDVRGVDTTLAERHRAYWNAADPGYSDATLSVQLSRPGVSWLRGAGVRYVISQAGVSLSQTRPVRTESGITISKVPDSRSFVSLSPTWQGANGQDSALRQLRGEPDGKPVLEDVVTHVAPPGTRAGTVSVARPDPEDVQITTAAPTAQSLVVLQSWDTGWQATIDGHSASLHPTDVAFQGMIVPPGHHKIELTYHAPGLLTGAVVSIVALLVLILILAFPYRRTTPK